MTVTYGNLHLLPLTLFILIPVTFVITYTISVRWNHDVPTFPYISQTGGSSPESCIFAQLLNIAALLLGFCIYIRHRQVEQWRVKRGENLVEREMVVFTACCGALSCLGLDVLANFNENEVRATHMTGALICFTAGTLYFCLETYLSGKMVNAVNGSAMVYTRGALSLLAITLTVVTIISGYVSILLYPDDKSAWRVTSVVAEWILVIVYATFLLTFVPDFRMIHWEQPRVTLIYSDRFREDEKISTKTADNETTVRYDDDDVRAIDSSSPYQGCR